MLGYQHRILAKLLKMTKNIKKQFLSKPTRIIIALIVTAYFLLSAFMNWTFHGNIFPRSFLKIFTYIESFFYGIGKVFTHPFGLILIFISFFFFSRLKHISTEKRGQRLMIRILLGLIVVYLIVNSGQLMWSHYESKYIFRKKGIAQNEPQSTPSLTVKSLPKAILRSRPVISENGNLYAILLFIEQPNGSYEMNLSLNSIYKGDKDSDNNLLTEIIKKEEMKYYADSVENRVVWSPLNDKIAVLIQDGAVIYNYTELDKKMTLGKPKMITFSKNIGEFHKILFSGDGTQVYVGGKSGIYVVYPEFKKFTIGAGDAYPILNSRGVVYLSHLDSKEKYPYSDSIVLDFGTYSKHYPFPYKGVDYIFDVLVSPGQDKACVKWGSSGTTETLIFELISGRKISTNAGHCKRWLNNAEVIVQGTFGSYFLLNTISGKKTLLFSYDYEDGYDYLNIP